MSAIGTFAGRVATLQWSTSTQQQINTTEQQLLTAQNQLSTGKKITVGSDDPGNAAIIMQLQQTQAQRAAYGVNLTQTNSQLSEVDSSLGGLTTLIQQAQQIASKDVGSTTSDAERAADADIVQTLYNRALDVANTKFNGQYIYGGEKDTTAPFVATTGGVQFVGSTSVLQNSAADNTLLPFQVSAAGVFGAFASQVKGNVNLTPSASLATRLSDLGGTGGGGVHPGLIQLGNGVTSTTIDLSKADSLGDVINDINSAGVGNITAALNAAGSGITLSTSGADNITVQEVGGGTTANDLGILRNTGSGAGASLVGTGLQPKVTDLTPLASLRGGAGIDQTHGLVITSGQKSATIDLSAAKTVEDVLNAINGAGLGVSARINSGTDGIDILNAVQGTQITVGENGGATASDLGVRSFSAATQLSQLNGGKGVGTVPGGDFQVTRSDGSAFNVSLAGAKTAQDVINAINTASGGTPAAGVGVTASFAATGNGIVLDDTAGGGGTLAVTAINDSTAAADLGLNAPASNAGKRIAGADVNPVATSGLFSDLADLEKALRSGSPQGITSAGSALQTDYNNVVQARGANGAALQDVQARQTDLGDESTAATTLLSSLQDTDFATAVSRFQTLQTSLQATLQTGAKVLHLSLLNFIA